MSHRAWLTLVLVMLLGGCVRSTPEAVEVGPSKKASAPPDLPAGTEVTLLGQERDFARVQLPDGGTGFVRLGRLVTLETGGPGGYLVVEPGPIYAEVPPLPPDPAEPPRSRGEILVDQTTLPAGFMTADSSKLALLPDNKMPPFRDEETGKWMWPAYVCYAPDCPAHKAEGKPHIFPHFNPTIETDSRTARYTGPLASRDAALIAANAFPYATCPQCLKVRNLAAETPHETQRYRNLVRRYVPTESVARRLQLEDEYRRLLRSQLRQ